MLESTFFRHTAWRPFAQDRAALVAKAVSLVFKKALLEWLDRDDAHMAAARAEVATILRE
jgi:hypothetical protein